MIRAIVHPETDDFLGNIVHDATGWQAQTIFGYIISRTETEADAERIIREQGQDYLRGMWQYYDKDEYHWFPCVIKDAYESKVSVIRTNALGYQEPDLFKLVIIEHPNEERLVKSS